MTHCWKNQSICSRNPFRNQIVTFSIGQKKMWQLWVGTEYSNKRIRAKTLSYLLTDLNLDFFNPFEFSNIFLDICGVGWAHMNWIHCFEVRRLRKRYKSVLRAKKVLEQIITSCCNFKRRENLFFGLLSDHFSYHVSWKVFCGCMGFPQLSLGTFAISS